MALTVNVWRSSRYSVNATIDTVLYSVHAYQKHKPVSDAAILYKRQDRRGRLRSDNDRQRRKYLSREDVLEDPNSGIREIGDGSTGPANGYEMGKVVVVETAPERSRRALKGLERCHTDNTETVTGGRKFVEIRNGTKLWQAGAGGEPQVKTLTKQSNHNVRLSSTTRVAVDRCRCQ